MRRLAIPAVIVAVLAIGVDIAQWLRAAPLWLDEEMIALNIRDRTFAELPGQLWLGQGAPLGWLFIQRAIVLAFGTSELSLRVFPLAAGAATVLAAVWVGVRWMQPMAAAFFVLLCSIGQWMSHYRFEVKHYSADTFTALLLPALAVWAVEDPVRERAAIRWTRWWLVASIAQWVAYGALLVTPFCAVLLALVIWIRHGTRAAVQFASTGVVWLLSFAAHYALSLQYTDSSRHLRDYWAGHVLPHGLRSTGAAEWIASRFVRLASNPGGSELVVVFWIAAILGLFVTRRRLLGAMFVSVPVSGFVLAAIGQVPLDDRLALWIVPSLYLGIALLLDAGLEWSRRAWRADRRGAAGVAGVAAAAALLVGGGIIVRGYRNLDVGVGSASNHGLDDRKAVAWLLARHQPGDVIVTTQLGWPAVWWYGRMPIRHPVRNGILPDGTAMLSASHERSWPGCREQMDAVLEGKARVLLYAGFPDEGEDFYDVFVDAIAPHGRVVDFARFAGTSLVAVIELAPPVHEPPDETAERSKPSGCVALRVARRWT